MTPPETDAGAPGSRRRDYLLTIAGALGMSTAPILFTLSGAAPVPGAVWRFLYALLLLAPLCLLSRTGRTAFRRSGWIALAALSGLFFAADIVLWHHSIGLIGAGPATLLANTQVIWLALAGVLFLRERPSRLFWAALPLALAGMYLLAGAGPTGIAADVQRRGLLLGAAAGLAYAGVLFFLRRAQRVTPIPPEAALLVLILCALGVLTPLGWAEGSLPRALAPGQHVWLATLGLGVQGLAWLAISRGIRQLPGHHGGMLLLVQPVASLALGWWILDQPLDAGGLVGAALILIGVAVPILRETRS